MTSKRLEGARAIITGGTRGIGRAVAAAFAREGASVVICGRGADAVEDAAHELRQSTSERIAGMVCDVSDGPQVEAFMEQAAGWLGGVDVLVNNAGLYSAARFEDLTDDDWSRVFDVNVFGTVRCTRAALPYMAMAGRIVNIASTAGKYGSLFQSAYNASKHAVVGLTRCLALEYANSGIRVNAICPGFVETTMIPTEAPTLASLLDVAEDEVVDRLRQRVPVGRFVTPEEVAQLAVYLASPAAEIMTGQAITISGGLILV